MRGKKAREQRKPKEAEKTAARIAAAIAEEFGAEGAEMSDRAQGLRALGGAQAPRSLPGQHEAREERGEVEVLYSKDREELATSTTASRCSRSCARRVPNQCAVRVAEGGEVLDRVDCDRGCFAVALADGRSSW